MGLEVTGRAGTMAAESLNLRPRLGKWLECCPWALGRKALLMTLLAAGSGAKTIQSSTVLQTRKVTHCEQLSKQ